MLRRLHRRHEVHYVAFHDPAEPEGVSRAGEYSSRSYPIPFRAPDKSSLRFYGQLAANALSPRPLAVDRFRSHRMSRVIGELIARQQFDSIVCDFLTPAINVPDLSRCVLFQHNVESMIWDRRAQHAGPLQKPYFDVQARRMNRYEGDVCRAVKRVIAVSEADAHEFERRYGLKNVGWIPTGVAVDDLTPPAHAAAAASGVDLVFVGSMDWMPNVDAMQQFVGETLPLIRRRKPGCSLAIVGRTPPKSIRMFAERDPLITVTGTVPDVRPYLWGAAVFIVPLRVGGGTRLKIYESMAARVPVVSTTIGAEGLDVRHGESIRIADTPEDFAGQCIELLESAAARERLAATAWRLVSTRFGWERVAAEFEDLVFAVPALARTAAAG
jgi:glycosyltransferase involved in cell wall biosynthesis